MIFLQMLTSRQNKKSALYKIMDICTFVCFISVYDTCYMKFRLRVYELTSSVGGGEGGGMKTTGRWLPNEQPNVHCSVAHTV